jgi:Cyclic nucleotide-binding domain
VMGVIPRLADDAVIGRVYGLCELLHAGIAASGAALAPLLVHAFGIGGSLAVVGIGYSALALLGWRPLRRLDEGEQTAGRVRDLLHGVPFLASLPLPHLERLVRAASPLAVAAGQPIVQFGDTGTDFYVIDSGTVEIVEYGRRQGPGEGFGEIALLRDVPRTATVRACTETRLWLVKRSTFLAAVGASPEALGAADDIIAGHLARPRIAAWRPQPRSAR